jgi:SAM-dependent methyltransferase
VTTTHYIEDPLLATAAGQRPSKEPVVVSASEGYDRWASGYDSTPNPLLALEQRAILPLLPPLNDKLVIDLACGTGRWFDYLAANGAAGIFGVDFSAKMLSVAVDKCQSPATLIRADVCRLPFSNNYFDFAICSFTVGHIASLHLFARECRRVLNAAALLFVTDLHPEAYSRGWRTGFRDQGGAVEVATVTRSPREFLEAFHSAGFELTRTDEVCFGLPEKPIFLRAGKGRAFRDACRLPALLSCCFRVH